MFYHTLKGLQLAWLEERVALYTDDLLILEQFSEVTGFRVNWSKSQLFAINAKRGFGFSSDTTSEQIYLRILGNVANFIPVNLSPVVNSVRAKLKAWDNLPLSLLGRINLIKIKILPKFTYLLRNSPQWIPY